MSSVEEYYAVFPSRLRYLIRVNHTTITALAAQLGLSRQAVSLYTDGSTLPNAERLGLIADYFRVSTDWLLGRTDVRSPDVELQAAAEYTRLSEKAAERLHLLGSASVMENGQSAAVTDMLSDLIESDRFYDLFGCLGIYLIYGRTEVRDGGAAAKFEPTDGELLKLNSWAKAHGLEILSRDSLKELYLQRAADIFKRICEEIAVSTKEADDNG